MSFQDAAEGPIAIGSLTFPKLTIRTTAAVAAKCQTIELERLKKLCDEQKMLPENKVKFLALTAAADYGQGHVQDWSLSAEGSMAICVASLVQGGKSEVEAQATIDALGPTEVREAAMEICEHPNSPRRVLAAKAAAKAEADARSVNPQ